MTIQQIVTAVSDVVWDPAVLVLLVGTGLSLTLRSNTMNVAIDVLGWMGAAALLLAYWLVSTRRTTGHSITYQALNMMGSVLVLANSLYYGAYPSVGVNAVWLVIGVYALSAGAQRDPHTG